MPPRRLARCRSGDSSECCSRQSLQMKISCCRSPKVYFVPHDCVLQTSRGGELSVERIAGERRGDRHRFTLSRR